MENLEIKNNVLNELNNILNISVQKIEEETGENLQEFIKRNSYFKSNIDEFLSMNSYLLPDLLDISLNGFKMNFPSLSVAWLITDVKSKFPKDVIPKNRSKSKKQNDYSGLELQRRICIYREAYQNGISYDYPKYSRGEITKKTVENLYNKSKPNDLICLCWKYITDPRNLEGIHYHWENPVAKYEPYDDANNKHPFKVSKVLEEI